MFSKRAGVVVFLCCLAACSRSDNRATERIAVLPFENLTSNADLDWVSRVSGAVLAYDLTGPRGIHPIRVESIRDARANRAGRTLEGYFALEHGDIAFHATAGDRMYVVRARNGDVASALNRLAKNFNPRARSVSGCDASSMHSFGQAAPPDSSCIVADLQWAEAELSRGNRDGAARVSAAALENAKADAIDRGELLFLSAIAKGDPNARLGALEALSLQLPTDPELLRNLGAAQLAARRYQGAANTLEAATSVDPEDGESWNNLGYSRAALHDLKAARAALERYQRLLPAGNTNGLDSLGEVSFFLGDFAAAEQYFLSAFQKNPEAGAVDLVKAAQAHMMTGDLAGADRIIARRPNWGGLEQAQWEFMTGRRRQAIARAQALPQAAPVAFQLALWNAQTGQGPAPPEGNDPLTRTIDPLLTGQFHEVVPLLEELYRASNPAADSQVRTLLAWAYARSGQPGAAVKLLDLYPIPLAGGGDNSFIASLVFPRFLELRGELLGSEKDQQLAKQYAGDLPDRVK